MVFSWRIRSRAPADAPPGMVRVSPIRVITPKTLLGVVPQVPLIACPPCYRHSDDVLLIGTRHRVCFIHVVSETCTARSERTSSTAPGALQVASSPAHCCAQPGPAARHRQSLLPIPLVAPDGDKSRQYIGIGGMPGIGLLLDLERIPRAAGGVQAGRAQWRLSHRALYGGANAGRERR